uniref:Uncharacterized protein n=1 Tax=Fagus sylvatica TaxID=28930 RepID=A0A2N9F9Z3_FAGSY
MLGTGRLDLEQMLRQFENQHHDKIRSWVGFSVKTAHRITAGLDILLMPSRFEPCGLNQLYAMSYGTVPVVHAVGGLRDTVQPFNPFNESGLGWTFDSAEANKLIHALGNCLFTYQEYKQSWEGLQRRGMMQDLSWDNAAQNYEEVLVAAKYQWSSHAAGTTKLQIYIIQGPITKKDTTNQQISDRSTLSRKNRRDPTVDAPPRATNISGRDKTRHQTIHAPHAPSVIRDPPRQPYPITDPRQDHFKIRASEPLSRDPSHRAMSHPTKPSRDQSPQAKIQATEPLRSEPSSRDTSQADI